MRTISANALAKIATDKGTEPVIVLEISWGPDAVAVYADKAVGGIQGKILEVSGLDEIVQVTGGGQSQSINVTLDDTDGDLKAVFDSIDMHKKSVRVWQWFTGLDYSDKFLLFKGQVNSPVVWVEGERKISFSVINRIEDVEVGFSAEEGEFYLLPEELIGQPWPLCFGTVIDVPALRAIPAISGTLAAGVGIKDFTLKRRLALAEKIVCPLNLMGFGKLVPQPGVGWIAEPLYVEDPGCRQRRCTEIERLKVRLSEETSYEYPVVTIFGGKKFPQNKVITLDINAGLFNGYFMGTDAAPSEEFRILWRRHPRDDGKGNVKVETELERTIRTKCEGENPDGGPRVQKPDDGRYNDYMSTYGTPVLQAAASQKSWKAYSDEKAADFFWAGGGTTVLLADDNSITYIANLLPSTILRVAAYRTIGGNKFLLTVPSDYYEINLTNYTGYQVVEIRMLKPLSTQNRQTGGGWEDEIYITMTSSVGPNTVDIIEWFIETYTEYGVDTASFNETRALVENYPQHFPLLSRKNLFTVLQEIAEQARCALWMKDDTFYIRYLSKTPTPVATITEDDILASSLEISMTSTEDIITKYVAKWKKTHAHSKPNILILRHNVKDYGMKDRTFDYYTFNILELVRKTATYWLIRKANAWKRLKFRTALTHLRVEPFDAVTISTQKVSDVPVVGIVEKAIYDSDTREIEMEVWMPIKAGTRAAYDFAWPADIQEYSKFPSQEDKDAGKAGSGTEPNFSTIPPPQHPFAGGPRGFPTYINLDREDQGDPEPSDEGDVKPVPETTTDNTGNISVGTSPVSDIAYINNDYFGQAEAIKRANEQGNANSGQAKTDAEQAKAAAGVNDGQAGGDDLGKQPDPRDPNGDGTDDESKQDLADDCKFAAAFTIITPKSVSQQNGPVTSEQGAAGRAAQSEFNGPHEVYFGTYDAAVRFQQNLGRIYTATWKAWGQKVGSDYKFPTGQVINTSQNCPASENPDEILGYHNGGSGPNATLSADEIVPP